MSALAYNETTLMEREHSGFRVALKWLPITGLLVLEGQAGDVMRAVTVPPEKAREAFDHPCVWLPEPGEFFERVLG